MKDKQGDDFAKVGKFLKGLTVAEHFYLGHVLQTINYIKSIVEKFELTKERACELFHIKPSQYDNYTKGNYTYTVRDMAVITAVYRKLEAEKVAEAELFKVKAKLAEKEAVRPESKEATDGTDIQSEQ